VLLLPLLSAEEDAALCLMRASRSLSACTSNEGVAALAPTPLAAGGRSGLTIAAAEAGDDATTCADDGVEARPNDDDDEGESAGGAWPGVDGAPAARMELSRSRRSWIDAPPVHQMTR
jgi:hypothetical protein